MIIYFKWGWNAFLYCALAGIIVAAIAFLYTLLRAEGEIRKLKKFLKRLWVKYERFETRMFRWWDEL